MIDVKWTELIKNKEHLNIDGLNKIQKLQMVWI